MTVTTIEVHLKIDEVIARRLRAFAQARGLTEDTVIAQALDVYFGLDDTPPLADYWFSVAAMRDDWEAMPEDWSAAPEVSDVVPTR